MTSRRFAPLGVAAVLLHTGCDTAKSVEGFSAASAVAGPAPAPVALVSPVSTSPAAPPDPAVLSADEARSVEQSCKSLCALSAPLGCPQAGSCVTSCLGLGVGTPCTREVSAFYRCLAATSPAQWECDDEGAASIREGLCDAEQERVVSCIETKAR